MAKFLGIPSNEVKLIRSREGKEYKHYKDSPATLHTLIPGRSGCTFRPHVKIQQPAGGKCKGLCGLSERVIKSMTKHPTLPLIVALDTFVGAADRGCPNFMYDKQTDTIYGIDFNSGFQQNLAIFALHNLKDLECSDFSFSAFEIQALKQYRHALARLVAKFKPKQLFSDFVKLIHEAGLFEQQSLRNELKNRLVKHKKAIRKSYTSTKRLINYLDKTLLNANPEIG